MKEQSVKEVHSALGMHSVRFAQDEQQRRKQQQAYSSGRILKGS